MVLECPETENKLFTIVPGGQLLLNILDQGWRKQFYIGQAKFYG